MEHNKYHKTVERITTPPELKEKTRRMLITEIKKRRTNRMTVKIISIAAVFILAAGAGIWMLSTLRDTSGSPGASPGADADSREVELNFIFVPEDTQPVRMAHTYPLRQSIQLHEMQTALPVKAPDGFDEPEGGITLFFTEPSDKPDAVLGEAFYWSKSVSLITVTFTDTAMIYLPVEIGGSFIDDVQIGLGYTESDDKLFAVYEQNGFTYLLTAERLTRQEFAQVLLHFIAG